MFRVLNPEGYPPAGERARDGSGARHARGEEALPRRRRLRELGQLHGAAHGWFEEHRPAIRTEVVRWRNQHIPDPELCERIQADGDAAIIGVGT